MAAGGSPRAAVPRLPAGGGGEQQGGRGRGAVAGRAGAGRVTGAVPETATSRRCAHALGSGAGGAPGAAALAPAAATGAPQGSGGSGPPPPAGVAACHLAVPRKAAVSFKKNPYSSPRIGYYTINSLHTDAEYACLRC